jgi:hypothetical protein
MALVSGFGRAGILCGLVALAAAGCGGGDDDSADDGGGAKWKCYDNTTFAECDCYNLPPGELYEDQTEGSREVSSCPSYELCLKYYDTFFEWDACACGASDLMPLDAMDIQTVSACPPPG